MEISLEHNLGNIDPEDWNRLCFKGPTNTIFQTYQWHAAWLEEFGKDNKLFLVQVKENGKLIGLAPLGVIKKGPLRILKFIGTGHSDYCDFIYDKADTNALKEILKFLKTRMNDWDAMALDHIPEGSETVRVIDAFCRDTGLLVTLYSKLPCPVFIFDPHKGNAEELTNKKRLRDYFQYFQEKGGYQVLHANTAGDITPFLEQFFEQHIQRCKTTDHQSLFGDERNQRFYKGLVKYLCPNQWLNFTVVQSQGNPIAFHFGLIYGRKFICYKPSFDHRLSKFSPGQVLLRELFIYSIGKKCEEFDFSIGDEDYKRRFTNKIRMNFSFKVFKTKKDYWLNQVMNLPKMLRSR
jgi:CelD/BcsL family acetyltransferase involved in cellulose biosynthesis